jgi:hypothetical protein
MVGPATMLSYKKYSLSSTLNCSLQKVLGGVEAPDDEGREIASVFALRSGAVTQT